MPNQRSNASAPCSISIPQPVGRAMSARARPRAPRRLAGAIDEIEHGGTGRRCARPHGQRVVAQTDRRRVHDQRRAVERRVHRCDTTSRRRVEARRERRGSLRRCDCTDGPRAEPHRSTAASTAAAAPPAPRSATRADLPRRAEERAARSRRNRRRRCCRRRGRRPSCQNVFTAPHAIRERLSASHSAATASLCGIVTLPRALCRGELGERRVERVGCDVERLVAQRDAGRAKRGVLEARRQRVRRPDARAGPGAREAPHDRAAATRSAASRSNTRRISRLELVRGRAVDVEVAAEGIADRAADWRRATRRPSAGCALPSPPSASTRSRWCGPMARIRSLSRDDARA